ncbi:MAG: nitroreductase [Ruminococcaceae bacterium]|nr:nitroreductase [Oscillospiraceae bacterium]
MTFDEIVRSRRSIRRYQSKPVPPEALQQILETARLGPSSHNYQNWHFTVVQNAGTREKLMEACNGQKYVGEAPAVLVVWFPEERMMTCGRSSPSVDGAIAMTLMMLKATELGLGTCWLANFRADAVAEVLGLPAGAVVVTVSPLGYPDEAPEPRPRKTFQEVADIRDA